MVLDITGSAGNNIYTSGTAYRNQFNEEKRKFFQSFHDSLTRILEHGEDNHSGDERQEIIPVMQRMAPLLQNLQNTDIDDVIRRKDFKRLREIAENFSRLNDDILGRRSRVTIQGTLAAERSGFTGKLFGQIPVVLRDSIQETLRNPQLGPGTPGVNQGVVNNVRTQAANLPNLVNTRNVAGLTQLRGNLTTLATSVQVSNPALAQTLRGQAEGVQQAEQSLTTGA